MLQFVLEILVDFGLIRENFIHHKKITKKEKEDGVKRTFQKYVLQPTTIIVIISLILVSICIFMFSIYQIKSVYPKKTKEELSEMTEWIEKWNNKFGAYPENLNEAIGNNPMHQHWDNDAWNRPYKYILLDGGKSFLLISSGPDGKFETKDDIKQE